jgi:predicted nucleic acid-binding protein
VIAADTSSWISYLSGEPGEDVTVLDHALAEGQVCLPVPVLTELLSHPRLDEATVQDLLELPLLEPTPGYWVRAGRLRAEVLKKGRRARLGDALIAQLCIDHSVRLITRDKDFRAFAEAGGLSILHS